MVRIAFALIMIGSLAAHAQTIQLTQKDVAEKILKVSRAAQLENIKTDLQRYNYIKARAAFDFDFDLSHGYQESKFENFSGTANPRDTSLLTVLKITKPFVTGTVLGVEFNRTQQRSLYAANNTNPPPSEQTQSVLGFGIRQNLWNNFFGDGNRAALESAESLYKASQVERSYNLQNLVLKGVKDFWNTYIAQENFKEAVTARTRYERLVSSVRRKSGYGYTNPGELPQILAEFESTKQNVKSTSTAYLAALDSLINLLGLPRGAEIKLVVEEQIPELPDFAALNVENLRVVRAAELKRKSFNENYTAAESATRPDLSLVANYYGSGIEENADKSTSEMLGRDHNKYYVGLNFRHKFGSDEAQERLLNARLQKEQQSLQYTQTVEDTKDKVTGLERTLRSQFAAVASAREQRDQSAKAAAELNNGYSKGRTTINDLITSLNKSSTAQINYYQAISNYFISINEWAALQDKLVVGQEGEYK